MTVLPIFHSTSLPNFNILRHTQPSQQQVQCFKNLIHMLRIREKKGTPTKNESLHFQFYARNLIKFCPTLSGRISQTVTGDVFFIGYICSARRPLSIRVFCAQLFALVLLKYLIEKALPPLPLVLRSYV